MIPKWLIYCRVSSNKQVKEWSWLSSQEKRCKDFAKDTLWIEIEKVFYDEWVSGWIFERKSIQNLLKYIDTNKNNDYVVIFEDLNRLSRDIQVHNLLRNEFRKRWVELQCPNFQFEESPEWTFRENMSVSIAQYEKDKNKQRVLSRMESRLKQGYWCFPVPIWYKYIKDIKWWKIVALDKKYYKTIRSILNKFAYNELKSINDVARYLNNKWIKVWTVKKWKVYNANLVSRLLRNIIYTWYIEYKKWWIERTKWQHEALIDLKTYELILKKLKKLNNEDEIENKIEENNNRIDKSNDFPLRWFLYCETSKQMITWAWSKWKKAKFPYYIYPRKSPLFWKSINRDKLHEEFENLLKSINPKEDLIKSFELALDYVLEQRKTNEKEIKERLKKDITEIDKKINNFLERIWKTNSEILISNYEKQIENLEKEKEQILEKIEHTMINVRTPLKKKIELVRNSLEIWKSSNLENKKILLKNIFPAGIPINKNRTVWTPKLSLIYQVFDIWNSSYNQMVDWAGLEPATSSLRGICSTNWATNP